jgi:hypothetical protein
MCQAIESLALELAGAVRPPPHGLGAAAAAVVDASLPVLRARARIDAAVDTQVPLVVTRDPSAFLARLGLRAPAGGTSFVQRSRAHAARHACSTSCAASALLRLLRLANRAAQEGVPPPPPAVLGALAHAAAAAAERGRATVEARRRRVEGEFGAEAAGEDEELHLRLMTAAAVRPLSAHPILTYRTQPPAPGAARAARPRHAVPRDGRRRVCGARRAVPARPAGQPACHLSAAGAARVRRRELGRGRPRRRGRPRGCGGRGRGRGRCGQDCGRRCARRISFIVVLRVVQATHAAARHWICALWATGAFGAAAARLATQHEAAGGGGGARFSAAEFAAAFRGAAGFGADADAGTAPRALCGSSTAARFARWAAGACKSGELDADATEAAAWGVAFLCADSAGADGPPSAALAAPMLAALRGSGGAAAAAPQRRRRCCGAKVELEAGAAVAAASLEAPAGARAWPAPARSPRAAPARTMPAPQAPG